MVGKIAALTTEATANQSVIAYALPSVASFRSISSASALGTL